MSETGESKDKAVAEEAVKTTEEEHGINRPETSAERKRARESDVAHTSEFLDALEKHRKRGRVAVLDEEYDAESGRTRYQMKSWTMKNCEEIEEKHEKAYISEHTCLVVMEDLGANWVPYFAKWLQIPEHIFALHWAHPQDHLSGQVGVPLGTDPKQHFILQYKQLLPFKVGSFELISDGRGHETEDRDLACTADRSICRYVSAFSGSPIGEFDAAEQLVSYYCGNHNGRDIAVILLDPCPTGDEQFPEIGQATFNRKDSMLGEQLRRIRIHADEKKPHNLGNGFIEFTNNNHFSMYDKILQHFDDLDETIGPMPPSETETYKWAEYCCSVVLARNAYTVQSLFSATWDLVVRASTGVKNMADFDFAKLERQAWSDKWKGDFFTQLWELREELESLQYRLNMNHQVLNQLWEGEKNSSIEVYHFDFHGKRNEVNVRNIPGTSPGSWSVTCHGEENFLAIENEKSYLLNPVRQGKSTKQTKSADHARHELEEWSRLINMNAYAIQLMNRTTETYVQAIGATSAQFANEQAKNSRRLTGFAALFVPASLCAAILAIPSFTPDVKDVTKFWVFWVVSVPLAIILAVSFLTDVPDKMRKKWDNQIRDLLNHVPVGSLRGRFVRRMIPESDASMV